MILPDAALDPGRHLGDVVTVVGEGPLGDRAGAALEELEDHRLARCSLFSMIVSAAEILEVLRVT